MKKRLREVPFYQHHKSKNEVQYVNQVLKSGVYSNGPFTKQLEQAFLSAVGAEQAVACSSGTSALRLALEALDVRSGHEVIVSDLCPAVIAKVIQSIGAIPVPVDVDESTWLPTLEAITDMVNYKTKAIVVVDLFGVPPDYMDALLALCSEKAIWLIEDAAHAFGSLIFNRQAGTLGFVSTFSFSRDSVLSCGEGGMVVSSDVLIDARLRRLLHHDNRLGSNSRMTEMQAAIALSQLEDREPVLNARRRISSWYHHFLPIYRSQKHPIDACPVYSQNCVCVPDGVARDAVLQSMRGAGVEVRPISLPLHGMGLCGVPNDLYYRTASLIGNTAIMLPSHSGLVRDEVEYVADNFVMSFSSDDR